MSRSQDLLLAAGEVYVKLQTYRDAGEVTCRRGGDAVGGAIRFSTRFLRPSLFQFRFESPHPYPPLAHKVVRHVCGLDNRSAYHWSTSYGGDEAKIQDVESMDMAIAGATGISSGSAFTIAQLLFMGAQDWNRVLKNLVGRDKVEVEGFPCHVLCGLHKDVNVKMFFYLDQETLLLRKLTCYFQRFTSDEIRRDIEVNERIPLDEFARPIV